MTKTNEAPINICCGARVINQSDKPESLLVFMMFLIRTVSAMPADIRENVASIMPLRESNKQMKNTNLVQT